MKQHERKHRAEGKQETQRVKQGTNIDLWTQGTERKTIQDLWTTESDKQNHKNTKIKEQGEENDWQRSLWQGKKERKKEKWAISSQRLYLRVGGGGEDGTGDGALRSFQPGDSH